MVIRIKAHAVQMDSYRTKYKFLFDVNATNRWSFFYICSKMHLTIFISDIVVLFRRLLR